MYVERKDNKIIIFLDKADKCYKCKSNNKCILFFALQEGVVTLNLESVNISCCQQYDPKLKIVKGENS